jgi:hypothetical protein
MGEERFLLQQSRRRSQALIIRFSSRTSYVDSRGNPLSSKRRDIRLLVWISGEWLQRICSMSDHRAEAQSVVMSSATKTIRFVHSIHHTTNVSGTFAVAVFTSFLRVKSPKHKNSKSLATWRLAIFMFSVH